MIGITDKYPEHFVISRYLSNGRIDSSFGQKGYAYHIIEGSPTSGAAVAVQKSGRIIGVGNVEFKEDTTLFGICAYLPDGTPDRGFNNRTGRIKLGILNAHSQVCCTIALQMDGKIVIAGHASIRASNGYDHDLALYRINNDGSLDSTFGNGGLVTTNFCRSDLCHFVTVQPDGKILLLGEMDCSPDRGDDITLSRYMPNGSPDSSFGKNGRLAMDLGGRDESPEALGLQPDGKIIVTGYSLFDISTGRTNFWVARCMPDGSPDIGFGNRGIRIIDFIGQVERSNSCVLQLDGKILLGGSSNIDEGDSDIGFALVRLKGDMPATARKHATKPTHKIHSSLEKAEW